MLMQNGSSLSRVIIKTIYIGKIIDDIFLKENATKLISDNIFLGINSAL